MWRKSLTFRIISLSGLWISLALLATAMLLLSYYNDHIRKHYDAHVFMQLETMIASSRVLPDGTLEMDDYPNDARFRENRSGWYWEIRQGGRVLERSVSLGGASLDLNGVVHSEDSRVSEIFGPDRARIRVQAMERSAGPHRESLLFVVSAPRMGITDDVKDIAEHMLLSFVVLGIGLVIAVSLQVRVTLRPLKAISEGMSQIREGKLEKLGEDYPREVLPMVTELNNLLEHNSVLLKRARNQLGDLAHSIKNPLSVIRNEARTLEPEQQNLIMELVNDINASMDHHLTRARVFGAANVLGTRVHIRSVVKDLSFALQRIYTDKDLEIDVSGLGNCSFRGESQDLEEMLGNLMDNASKWARGRVIIHCKTRSNRCLVFIEDDGPGIGEDQVDVVLQRGSKLDDSMQGHGLGLGIVQDIVGLYDGKLTLSRSGYGGLCAELNLPGA